MSDVEDIIRQPVSECCEAGCQPSQELVDDQALAAMAKAIGHPARLRILKILAERRACVTGELLLEIPLAQSTISEHLRILRQAGLIQGEIEGPRTSYCLDREALERFKRAIIGI